MLRIAAAQVGVLVVQCADLPVRWRRARHGTTTAAMQQRDGHFQVVGNIALAHRQNRQTRFRAGLHARPDFHGCFQTGAAAGALCYRTHHAFVVALIVCDVAAGSQQALHRAPERCSQRAGDQVKDGRAAGAEQDFMAVKQLLLVTGFGHRHQQIGEPLRVGLILLGVAAGGQTFITFDADQAHGCAGVQPGCQFQRLRQFAAAGAAARHTDFKQHLKGVLTRMLLPPGFNLA